MDEITDWRMFAPRRVDEPVTVGNRKTFRPGDFVRCVGCKYLYFDPPVPPANVKEAI
jgi:hypothetical protein